MKLCLVSKITASAVWYQICSQRNKSSIRIQNNTLLTLKANLLKLCCPPGRASILRAVDDPNFPYERWNMAFHTTVYQCCPRTNLCVRAILFRPYGGRPKTLFSFLHFNFSSWRGDFVSFVSRGLAFRFVRSNLGYTVRAIYFRPYGGRPDTLFSFFFSN